MNEKDFKGLKVTDKVVANRDLVVNGQVVCKNEVITVVAIRPYTPSLRPAEGLVFGRLEDGAKNLIRFHYNDLEIVSVEEDEPRPIEILTLAEATKLAESGDNDIYLALHMEDLTPLQVLSMVEWNSIFLKIRK